MIRCAANLFSATLFNAGVVAAQPFCDRLVTLAETDETKSATFDRLSDVDSSVSCARAVGLNGARSLHCAWPFAYRSVQGTSAFDAMLAAVGDCAVSIPTEPSRVNHPDSYELRQFRLGGATVSVSLKDKSALARTYLFLRIERR